MYLSTSIGKSIGLVGAASATLFLIWTFVIDPFRKKYALESSYASLSPTFEIRTTASLVRRSGTTQDLLAAAEATVAVINPPFAVAHPAKSTTQSTSGQLSP